jgi:hypothetical protein
MCLVLIMVQIWIGQIRIGMSWMPIRILENYVDPTRSRSKKLENQLPNIWRYLRMATLL